MFWRGKKVESGISPGTVSHLAYSWNLRTQLLEAGSRLYRRRSQRLNTHWKALAEMYILHIFLQIRVLKLSWKHLFEARFRLFQRRFMQPKQYSSAFCKLYFSTLTSFQNLPFFKTFVPFSQSASLQTIGSHRWKQTLHYFHENLNFAIFHQHFTYF